MSWTNVNRVQYYQNHPKLKHQEEKIAKKNVWGLQTAFSVSSRLAAHHKYSLPDNAIDTTIIALSKKNLKIKDCHLPNHINTNAWKKRKLIPVVITVSVPKDKVEYEYWIDQENLSDKSISAVKRVVERTIQLNLKQKGDTNCRPINSIY